MKLYNVNSSSIFFQQLSHHLFSYFHNKSYKDNLISYLEYAFKTSIMVKLTLLT